MRARGRKAARSGHALPEVSVGSTPTALSATQLDGVTEVRAGVYALFDLVMANVGVCAPQDVALSVLTTVIGHQAEKGWTIVDAGWMAMSRDRGTQRQKIDYRLRRGVRCGRRSDRRARADGRQPGARHRVAHGRQGRSRHGDAASDRNAAAHPAQPRLRDRRAVPGVSGDHRAWCRAAMETFRWLVRSFKFNPATMAAPGGHYSHAISANGFVFVSGQLPIAPDGTSSTRRRSSNRRSRCWTTSRMR